MSENELKKKENWVKELLKKRFARYVIAVLVIVLILTGTVIGLKNFIFSDSKTTKLGFEDIGELATQSANCTEVNVTDASRELWGMEIPFTQSKYIYSYDVVIKAGFDFQKIKWSVVDTTIKVELPKAEILSNEIVEGSFKVYHEDESIFRQITLEENNKAVENLKKNAEKNAIANGLLDEAETNAESMLTAFFGSAYDMKQYKIKFTYK